MSDTKNRPFRDMQLESLEDRMLFDAVPIVDPELVNLFSDGVTEAMQVQAAEASESRTEVVFVDSGVEDPDTLLTGFSASNGNVEFQFLDASSDGLGQIADYLESRSDIDAIHILSHGNQAELILGNAVIRGDQLNAYADELKTIGNALSEGGDILIYGCDLASDATGAEFVSSFAAQTNRDVAASDDLTGHADLGGDWDLEYSSGSIETSVIVDLQAQNVWRGLLAPDLYVSKDDSQTTASTGDGLVYTIDYGNNGPDNATGAYLVETLPSGTSYDAGNSSSGWSETSSGSGVFEYTLGTLNAGTNDSVNFAVTVNDPLGAGIDNIFNSVAITDDGANGQDASLEDNVATDINSIAAAPDLVVMKDDGVTTTSAGSTLTYTINYRNDGDQDATGVVLTETLPPNTTFDSDGSDSGWNETSSGSGVFEYAIGALAGGGASGSVTFAIDVGTPAEGVSQLTNSVSIADDAANGDDADTSNNSSSDVNNFAGVNLSVTKDDGATSVLPNGTVIYTINYANNGTTDASGVVLTETLPTGVTFDAGNSDDDWQGGSGVYTLNVGSLAAGASGSVSFAVTVDSPVAAGVDDIVNRVSIADDGANGADLNLEDNSASDTNTIASATGVDLAVTKDDSQTSVTPGGSVVYTVNYANNGDVDASGVVLTESVPAGSTFDAGNSDANWVLGSGVYTLSVGDLAAGATGSAAFAVTVDDPIAAGLDNLVNTVSIADDGANGTDANVNDNTNTDSNAVDAAPDLFVTKDDGITSTSAGSSVVYTITYGNRGNQNATGVVLTETLPPGTTYDAANSTSGWSETSSGSGVFVFNFASLAAGTGGTLDFAVTVDDPLSAAVTEITNNVTISDDGNNGTDQDAANNSASDTNSVASAAGVDLTVTKDDSQTSVTPGGSVVYTVNYANNGDVDASGVVLTESVPAGSTFDAGNSDANWVLGSGVYTLSVGDLAAGATGSAAFAVTVDDPIAAGLDNLVNTVSIADDGANGTDANVNDNTNTDSNAVDAAPDLFVTKDDGITSTSAGSSVVYTITYGNRGNQNATGVVLTETLPPGATYDAANSTSGWSETSSGSGTFTLDVGNLAAGSLNNTAEFAVTVNDPASGSQLVNNVSIADDGANGPDPDATNNSDDDVDSIASAEAPDLVVTKNNGQSTVNAGGSVVYAISYSNVGNADATGVVITETLPPGSTYDAPNSTSGWTETSSGSGVFELTVGPLAAGGSGSANFAVVINDPLASGITQLVNNVSISDDGNNGTDPNLNNNSAVETDPINGVSGLNLFVSKDDGVTVANAGSTLIYTINYGNNGDVDTTGVVLTETLPAGATYDASNSSFGWNETSSGSGVFEFALGAVSSGTSGSVTFAVTVEDPLSAGINQLVNNVSIADDGANGAETNAADNADSDTDVVEGAPEYSIVKDDGITEAEPGDQITYTITVANNGTQGGTGIVVSDTFPATILENVTASNGGTVNAAGTITWNLGDLAAGDSVVVTVTATVASTADAGVEDFTNRVDVADDGANGADPDSNNNTDTDTDTLNAAPDLQVTKTDGGVNTDEGGTVVYTVGFANNGNQDATGVVLTETLPTGTSYDATNSTSGWVEASAGSGVFTFSVGDLAAGASGSVTFAVLVDDPLPAGTIRIDNSVAIRDDGGNGADPNSNDNTATDSTPVGDAPAYTVSKAVNATEINADGTLNYTITVTNVGGGAGSDIVVRETFDLGVFETVLADNGGIVDATAGTITWNLSSLAAGASVELNVTAEVEAAFAAGVDVVNCSVTVTDDDAAEVASASESVTLNAAPELRVLKTTDAVAANNGATVIYTITYSNNGTQNATGVLIEEHIQAGTAFDAANSDSGWVARGDDEHIDFAAGDLAVGESRTVRYAVTVTDVSLIGENLNNLVDVRDDGANGADPVTANNAAVNLLSTADPDAPEYSVVKAGDASEVTPEGTLTYTIRVTNDGTSAGSNVEVKESFDLGAFASVSADNNGDVDLAGGMVTWNIPTIAVGETVVLTVTAEVAPTFAAGVDVINCTVTVTDDDAAAVATAESQITLLAAPELTVSKTLNTGVVNNGDVVTYTITYTNEGNQDATGVVIEEHIVAGTSFNAANSDSGWVDRGDNEHIDFNVGAMAAGEVRTITFAVNISDVDLIGDRLNNVIEIRDDGTNGVEANLENNVQVVGVSTRVLDIGFISKRQLLSTTSTGAYDGLIPLSQLPSQQDQLPSQQGNSPESDVQVASSDPVVVPLVAESPSADDDESVGLFKRFSRLLNG